MSQRILLLGNKNYSSWSLRAWFFLRVHQVPFQEERVALFTDDWRRRISDLSPSGKVPVLREGDVRVWDSLAICEHVSERDGLPGWPSDWRARAVARSIVAEMHSGFAALRQQLPMNCRAEGRRIDPDEAASRDIQRIQTIWRECRERFAGAEGPWLFGDFTIADTFYAPVASRFRTYGVALDPTSAAYCDTVLGSDEYSEWAAAAREEPEIIDEDEAGAGAGE
jgi:glutathione S-transferase